MFTNSLTEKLLKRSPPHEPWESEEAMIELPEIDSTRSAASYAADVEEKTYFRRRSTFVVNKKTQETQGSQDPLAALAALGEEPEASSTEGDHNLGALEEDTNNNRRATLSRTVLSGLLDVSRNQIDDEEEGFKKKQRRQTQHFRNVGPITVIAFINRGSGGGKGAVIYDQLVKVLDKDHVFDLSECHKGNMPEDILKEYALDPFVRVLACGGDGTMGWIESSIDKVWQGIVGEGISIQCTQYASHLPLAMIPLGTGNDLSRTFGWGKTYKGAFVQPQHIQCIAAAQTSTLDRWRCVVIPASKLDDEARAWVPKMLGEYNASTTNHTAAMFNLFEAQNENITLPNETTPEEAQQIEMQVFDGVFCNYMSIGFDAQVAFKFHKTREEQPERFTSPLKNKIIYAKKSRVAWSSPTLDDKVKVLVANPETGKLEPLPVPKNCRAVVLMNIQSYAGGNQLARVGRQDDGLIEVLFLTGVAQMATAAVTSFKTKVAAQTNRVCIRTSQALHCQVDGEPWLQSEAFFQISHFSQNAFLKKTNNSSFANGCCSVPWRLILVIGGCLCILAGVLILTLS